MPLSGGIDFSELNLVGQRIKFDFEFPQGGNWAQGAHPASQRAHARCRRVHAPPPLRVRGWVAPRPAAAGPGRPPGPRAGPEVGAALRLEPAASAVTVTLPPPKNGSPGLVASSPVLRSILGGTRSTAIVAARGLSLNLSPRAPEWQLFFFFFELPAQRASGCAHHRGGRGDVSPGRSGFGAAPGTGRRRRALSGPSPG